MKNSLLNTLQLNREQKTLCETQQQQLLEVVDRLIRVNYDPHEGSILIIRAWADGTFEEVLSGNLAYSSAEKSCTRELKEDHLKRTRLTNEYHDSSDLVGYEVSEALNCEDVESFYYDKINTTTGKICAENGHYVLSLPIEEGRIIASFRANYCWCSGNIKSSINEPWQHQLILAGLAETLHKMMPEDERLEHSFNQALCSCKWCALEGHDINSAMIQRCLSGQHAHKPMAYSAVALGNSKLPSMRRQLVACV